MIYDGHAYCIQPPQENGGFASPAEFWAHLQMYMATARQQPAWRKSDRTAADSSGLVNPADPWNFDTVKPVNFRVGDRGKVEWTIDGVDYVKQVLPPWLQNMTFSADDLVAEMDYVGVDRALLHRTPYMSNSNRYIADCVRRHPDRIQGLAAVETWRIRTDLDGVLRNLHEAIEDLKLHGLQFTNQHLPMYGQDSDWTGPDFNAFWDEFAGLGVPLFLTVGGAGPRGDVEAQEAIGRWMQRYPEVTVVQTHGFDWREFSDDVEIHFPEEILQATPYQHPNYHMQVMFAIFLQQKFDYPIPQMRPVLRRLVDSIGPKKLLWGTDIPIGLLYLTYRQNIDYIRDYCGDFIGPREMDLLLGDNMARIMGMED